MSDVHSHISDKDEAKTQAALKVDYEMMVVFLMIYNGEQNHKVVPKSRSLIHQEVFSVVQVSRGYRRRVIKCL